MINETKGSSRHPSHDKLRAGGSEDTRSADPPDKNPKALDNATRAGGAEDTREVDDSANTFKQPPNVSRAGGAEDTRSANNESASSNAAKPDADNKTGVRSADTGAEDTRAGRR
jgi:hypothetical protein